MRIRRTDRIFTPRIYLLMGGMLFAFLVLGISLWRLQVAKVSQFESKQQIQSLRRVRLPGIRQRAQVGIGAGSGKGRGVGMNDMGRQEFRQDQPVPSLGLVIELLAELHDIDPVLAQGRANRRRGVCRSRWTI